MFKKISRMFLVFVFCLGVLNFVGTQTKWNIPLVGVKTAEAGFSCLVGYYSCGSDKGWRCVLLPWAGSIKCSPCWWCI